MAPPHVGSTKRSESTADSSDHGEIMRIFSARGFGFVRTATGDLLYFDSGDVLYGRFGRLKPGVRVRYRRDDALIPRATQIALL